jgi:integrase/recombinase XerD
MRRKPGSKPRPKPGEDFADPQSLGALLAQYTEWMRVHHYAADTLRTSGHALKLFVAWAAERSITRASEVTRPILERYQRSVFHYRTAPTAAETLAGKQGRPLGVRSQLARLSAVRAFFRYLVRHNLILYNPAADLDLPCTEKRLPRQVLTAAEVERVLNAVTLAEPMGLRDRAMLETLYSTGIRRQELVHLTLRDLDRERGVVLIRRGKMKKDRMVPIGERALVWITKYLDELRPKLAGDPDDGVLFLANYGEPVTPKRLSQITHDAITRAAIGKQGSCHLFRHTAATLMLEGGADIRYIQQLLGHASLSTTQIYTQVSIGKLKAVHTETHPAAQFRRRHYAEPTAAPDDASDAGGDDDDHDNDDRSQ